MIALTLLLVLLSGGEGGEGISAETEYGCDFWALTREQVAALNGKRAIFRIEMNTRIRVFKLDGITYWQFQDNDREVRTVALRHDRFPRIDDEQMIIEATLTIMYIRPRGMKKGCVFYRLNDVVRRK